MQCSFQLKIHCFLQQFIPCGFKRKKLGVSLSILYSYSKTLLSLTLHHIFFPFEEGVRRIELIHLIKKWYLKNKSVVKIVTYDSLCCVVLIDSFGVFSQFVSYTRGRKRAFPILEMLSRLFPHYIHYFVQQLI